jgi:hypothetical protein
MPGWSNQQPVPPDSQLRTQLLFHSFLLVRAAALVGTSPGLTEFLIVNVRGKHRMGDRDSREDAVRLATERSRRFGQM